jgi:integral membrane sensor domain MASE1
MSDGNRREQGVSVILALVVIYLAGWMLTTVGVVIAAIRLRTKSVPGPQMFGALTVAAGALWPLLLVGAVELGSVITYAKLHSRPSERTLEASRPQLARL